MKITIIFNPVAGAGKRKKLNRAVGVLCGRGIRPKIRETTKQGDARRFAAEEAERDTEVVIAAGGDGTINEVANGLAGSRVALGVVPLGVANLLALEMGIPADPALAVEIILGGATRLINPGYVVLEDIDSGKEIRRFFLLMAGIGFDGGILHDINRSRVESWGKAAYVMAGMRAMAKYTKTAFSVRFDSREELLAYSAVVGKSRFYGGKFMVTPRASLLDESLDACVFTSPGPLRMLKHAVNVLIGRHPAQGGVYYAKARELDIDSRDKVYIQVDGDYLGRLPARLGVGKNALQIVVPG